MNCVKIFERNNSYMAPTTTSPSVFVSLHPLVIMNISDHWTRIKAQQGKPTQVYGALLGRQKSRQIEICTSFEMRMIVNDNNTEDLDIDFLNTSISQYKQIYNDFDFLGWYTTGNLPTENDLLMQKQICNINESPILLKLDPFGKHTDLPITIFESIVDVIDNQLKMLFIELEYSVATEEAERIGVDHIAKYTCGNALIQSVVAENLTAQYSAINLLNNRIQVMLNYMQSTKDKCMAKNNEILREIRSLCHRLPIIKSENFYKQFYTQYNDTLWITYLGVLMQGSDTLNQYVGKFLVMYDKAISKRGRAMLL